MAWFAASQKDFGGTSVRRSLVVGVDRPAARVWYGGKEGLAHAPKLEEDADG
jgi:hypothetical protein